MTREHCVMERIAALEKDAEDSYTVFINSKDIVAKLIRAIRDQQLEIIILQDKIAVLEKKVGL